MKISFLMPGYIWGPAGGPRIVYEYANILVDRGHEVSVVHPRRVVGAPTVPSGNVLHWARNQVEKVRELVSVPSIDWQFIDKRVKMIFSPDSSARYIPEGDAVFATAWHTVRSLLEYPAEKGEKFYLIQGYETWMGPKDLVDDTWRAQVNKVVIAKWLLDIGAELGCGDMTYIQNAFNHSVYRVKRPIENRPRQISMLFSSARIKGAREGIEAIRIVRQRYPDLKTVFFGTSRRQEWVPDWVEYHRNPSQDVIVDKIYNGSSIFVSPSWTEGFPLPPAEAALCGCALVATDSGGILEYVEDGVTGLLSAPKDPVALAANICRLLEDETLRVSVAKACREVVSKLTWPSRAVLLEDCIDRALKSRDLQGRSAALEVV